MMKENKIDLILSVSGGVLIALLLFGVAWLNTRKPLLNLSENSSLQKEINSLKNQDRQQTQPLKVDRSSERTTLTLLGDTFSGYSTLRTSEFQGALSEMGIDLKYSDEFDQSQRAERLNQNNADIYVTTLDQFLLQKPQGKIVGLVDRTVGADAVVLNTKKYPFLKSVQDLEKLEQEKYSITYAPDTPSEFLALVLDTKFEAFKLSNFKSQPVADASIAWKKLQDKNENTAVAVLWEPYVTKASQLGYTVALSSSDAPTAIVDVIVASDRLLSSKPQVVSDFLKAYYRRIDLKLREPALMKQQIASDGNLSVAEASSVVNGIDFFSSVEAKKWMSDGTLVRRMGATAAILALSGKIEQIPESFQALYAGEFVDAAVKQTEQLIALVRQDNPSLAERLSGQLQSTQQLVTQDTTGNAIGNLQIRGEIQFATSSSFLTAAGRQTISRVAEALQEFNPQTIAVRVIGHTSATGDAIFNQDLSQRRAQTVVDTLKKAGVRQKIDAQGKGASQPLPHISPKDPRNQRTIIQLEKR